MEKKQVIPRDFSTIPGLNPNLLKEQALEQIRRYAGSSWTDHNVHDPGITILETLCYVITDLSYRLSFPLPDLLSQDGEAKDLKLFWKPEEILPSSPVNVSDYRRLLIDLPGVKNAWLSRSEKRKNPDFINQKNIVWDLIIQSEEWVKKKSELKLANKVRSVFVANRNVGDDLQHIRFIPTKSIELKMELVLKTGTNIEFLVGKILDNLRNIISPSTKKDDINNLINNGLGFDKVYDGPLLKHGVIDSDSLNQDIPVQKVFASDLIAAIVCEPTVMLINYFNLLNPENNSESSESNWYIEIEGQKAAALNLEKTINNISVVIDGHPVILDDLTKSRILKNLEGSGQYKPKKTEDHPEFLSGRYRKLRRYKTIQKEFPNVYKISGFGIREGEDPVVVAQIRQLQGFLLLYDQILANQFEQLELIRSLLSLPKRKIFNDIYSVFEKMFSSKSLNEDDIGKFWDAVKLMPRTQSSQSIEGIHQIRFLLGDYFNVYTSDEFNQLTEEHFSFEQLNRLFRLYEHLLARFHETVSDASLLKYSELIQHYLHSIQCHPKAIKEENNDVLLKKLVLLKQVSDMALFLSEYPLVSKRRAGAYDYLGAQTFGNDNTSALSLRISQLLGIPQFPRGPLATSNQEGFHLLESVLLRHLLQKDSPPEFTDPLNNQLYFIIPDWPSRFANQNFRQVLTDTIFRECPMHLFPRFVYLDRKTMSLFDRVYNAWLNAITQLPIDSNAETSLYNSRVDMSELPDTERISFDLISRLTRLLIDFTQPEEEYGNSPSATIIVERLLKALKVEGNSGIMTFDEKVAFCQEEIGKLIKPYPICSSSDQECDSLIAVTYRVGYRPIEHLKPVYPLAESVIHPSDHKKKKFTVGIAKPNKI